LNKSSGGIRFAYRLTEWVIGKDNDSMCLEVRLEFSGSDDKG
jgi:hypothetical protein